MIENDDSDERVVTIIPGRFDHPDAIFAVQGPNCMIRKDDTYILPIAVWEYDPREAEPDSEQFEDIKRLAQLFERALSDSAKALEAVLDCDIEWKTMQQTKPPGSKD